MILEIQDQDIQDFNMAVLPTSAALNVALKKAGVKDPDKARLIITGVGVALAGTVLFFAVRRWKRNREAKKYGAGEFAEEIMGIKINPNNLTITSGDALIIAHNLLSAMDRWGTDEQAIYDNLNRCKTKDDLLLVIQKFGMKMYDGMVLADDPIAKFFASIKDLQGWLRSELNGKQTRKVKEIYDRLGVPF